jgi:hypothetical protein
VAYRWVHAPFATLGEFVATVARTAEEFLELGVLTPEEKDLVVSTAARAGTNSHPEVGSRVRLVSDNRKRYVSAHTAMQ